MSTDDLATLLTAARGSNLRYGQGRLVAWNPDDFTGTVEWRGTMLEDLPVVSRIEALTYRPGDTVALIGKQGDRGTSSWWIFGPLIIPGGTEFAAPPLKQLVVQVLNAGIVNVDELTVGGKSLAAFIEDFIAEEDPQPQPGGTFTERYDAEWSQAYKGDNSRNTFDPDPVQGFFSSLNGNQRSLIGFPTSQIQSDLANAVSVTRVRVFLYFEHWYFNSGGTAVLGHHGHTSPPSTFSASTDNVRSSGWPKPGGRWVDYDVGMDDWIDGTKTGIAIGPGPSNDHVYYGRARAHDQSNRPRLEITWTE